MHLKLFQLQLHSTSVNFMRRKGIGRNRRIHEFKMEEKTVWWSKLMPLVLQIFIFGGTIWVIKLMSIIFFFTDSLVHLAQYYLT